MKKARAAKLNTYKKMHTRYTAESFRSSTSCIILIRMECRKQPTMKGRRSPATNALYTKKMATTWSDKEATNRQIMKRLILRSSGRAMDHLERYHRL